MRITDSNVSYAIDRRRHIRLPLVWTVYLMRPASVEIVEAKTKNVSCDGFYCLVHDPFAAGELIRCVIMIPAFDTQQPGRMVSLECQARVLRVERVSTGNGIACRIEDYKVVLASRDARSQIAAFLPWSTMQS